MEIVISYNSPIDVSLWNQLCELNGNLLQSTHYDRLSYYYSKNVFFEVYDSNKLIAGVKFSIWETRKYKTLTGWFNKTLSQFGELIIADSALISKVRPLLIESLKKYLQQNNFVCYTVGGYYGNPELLLDLDMQPKETFEFNVAYINLENKSLEELWDGVHTKHRNVIRKAEKSNCQCYTSTDFSVFYAMLKQTYATQDKAAPNEYYLKDMFESMSEYSSIYLADHNGSVLSASLVNFFGSVAYFSFSGTVKNSLGISNFLQWFIIKDLHNKNSHKYILGQVAQDEVENDNIKFVVGISKFKRRFGVEELPSFKKKYVLKKGRNIIWNMIYNRIQKK